jgi:hypothetical protein
VRIFVEDAAAIFNRTGATDGRSFERDFGFFGDL